MKRVFFTINSSTSWSFTVATWWVANFVKIKTQFWVKWGPSFCSICSHLAAPAALHHQFIYKNLEELFLASPGGVTHFQENIIVLNSVISAPFLALQKIIFQLREMGFSASPEHFTVLSPFELHTSGLQGCLNWLDLQIQEHVHTQLKLPLKGSPNEKI